MVEGGGWRVEAGVEGGGEIQHDSTRFEKLPFKTNFW
jgi:hypothetical protein